MNEPEAAPPSWIRFLLGGLLVAGVFFAVAVVDSVGGSALMDGHGYLGPLNGYLEALFAIGGAVLGGAQLVTVSGWIERPLQWVLATATGFLLGALSLDVLYVAGVVALPDKHSDGHPFFTWLWLSIAALTALGQWWTLRRFRRSPIWIAAAALGMGAGPLLRIISGKDLTFAVWPAIVYALITGLALFAIVSGGKTVASSK